MIHAKDILEALPHRYPFIMVDRVLELVPGKRAVALKTLSADAPFQGPAGCNASPEMLLIEAMAQVGALAYAFATPVGPGPADGPQAVPRRVEGYLAGLNDVVFHMRPRAGDTVELTLEHVASMGPLARFHGVAVISGATAAEAGLTFSVEEHI